MFVETDEISVNSPLKSVPRPLLHTHTHTQSPTLPIPPSPPQTHSHTQTHTPTVLPDFLTPRMIKFFLLPVVLLTALYTKQYTGEHQMIINNHVGGIFYVLFGSLLFSYAFRRMKIWQAVLGAFTLICLLEMLQWLNVPFIMALTENPVLSFLFGNSFNPVDFLYYGMGAVAGFLVLWVLHENQTDNP